MYLLSICIFCRKKIILKYICFFKFLCGFEPIFYSTHLIEEPDIFGIIFSAAECSNTEIFIGTNNLLISTFSFFFAVNSVFAMEAVV